MLLIAAVAVTMAAPARLDFVHPIDRAEVVFAELSKSVGVTIRPSGALRDDRIFVRLRDTDWESAMPMLAEGLRSEWRQRGDILYLHRPPFEPETSAKERIAGEFRKWQRAIKVEDDYSYGTLVERMLRMREDRRQPGGEYGYGSDVEEYVFLSDLDDPLGEVDGVLAPGVRALIRLMPLIDPNAIGDLLDEPATFASVDAKARDLPLPRSAVPVFKQFWNERETMRRVNEVIDPDGNVFRGFESSRFDQHFSDDNPMLVVVKVDESWIGLRLVVQFEGQLIQVGYVRIWLNRFFGWGAQRERKKFPQLSDPLELTKEEDAVAKLIQQHYSRSVGREPLLDEETSAYARSLLADPVANDPLRLVCQPVLEQAADARESSMVALLTDASILHAYWAGVESATVGQALATLVGGVWSAESVEKDGYWLLYPRDLSVLEGNRLNRERLKAFIETSIRINAFTLESLIGLFRAAGSKSAHTLSMKYANTVFGEEGWSSSANAISLLSGFSQGAIRAMRGDGYAVFGTELPLDFQRWILTSVCTTYDTLTDQPFDPTKGDSYGSSSAELMEAGDEPEARSTLLALRDGIQRGVKVQLKLKYETTLAPKFPEGSGFGLSRLFEMEVEQYARVLTFFRQFREQGLSGWMEGADFTKVSIGFQETLYVIIEFPGIGYTYEVMKLPTGRIKKEYVDYDDLPANIKSQIGDFTGGTDGGGQRP
ncbi:MAG: hypothetical protein IH944_10705 [Armatimonadetes bacterium]|nr:hypothetical protein [Armatimonadota bacterium]